MVKESTYLNKPLLTLLRAEDDRFGFSFGLAKAKLILENIDAITQFVEKNDAE
jgi:hypothetical protein